MGMFGGNAQAGTRGWLSTIFNGIRTLATVKGALSLTLILVFLNSINATVEAVKERTVMPIIKTIGGELINHDNMMYEESAKIEEAGGFFVDYTGQISGFWNHVKYYWVVFKSVLKVVSGLWYMYFFFLLFYKLSIFAFTNNSSAVGSNAALAVLFIIILQIFAHGVNYFIAAQDQGQAPKVSELAKEVVPFRGLVKFISVSPAILHPISKVSNTLEEIPDTVKQEIPGAQGKLVVLGGSA